MSSDLRRRPSSGALTLLASGSRPAQGTDAAEAVDLVQAGGPVGAGRRLALVDVCKGRQGSEMVDAVQAQTKERRISGSLDN